MASSTYTPAKSGVYFVRVNANGSGQAYTCSVTRTDAPAITTPDTDDIFGLYTDRPRFNQRSGRAARTDPNDV